MQIKIRILAILLTLAPWPALALSEPAVIDVPGTVGEPVLNYQEVKAVQEATLQRRQWAREAYRPIPAEEIDKLLAEAAQAMEKAQAEPAALQEAYSKFMQAQFRLMPSRNLEMRGVLIDGEALPTSAEGAKEQVRKLKAAGFNALLPEVFYRGYTVYPSKITETHPHKKNFDPLKALAEEARQQGMLLYPWLWTMRIKSPTIKARNPILERLPSLAAVPRGPSNRAPIEGEEDIGDESGAFMSPASADWRFLISVMLLEIAQRYPVHGFLLDYIRYGNNQVDDQLSWTLFQMEYFRKVGSFPSMEITPGSPLHEEWHIWREDQVNKMVQTLSQQVAKPKNLSLGAAIFRNEVNARTTKMQNWRHWSNNGWVDFVAPMLYARTPEELDLWLDWESDQGRRGDMLYPILGAHQWTRPAHAFNQLAVLQERGIPGFSVFAIRKLSDSLLANLGAGPFRNSARPPHQQLLPAARAQVENTRIWLGKAVLEIEKQNKNAPSLERLRYLAQQLLEVVTRLDQKQTQEAVSRLEELKEQLNQIPGLNLPLARELQREINYGLQLSQIYRAHFVVGRAFTPDPPPVAILPEAKPLPGVQIPYLEETPLIDGSLDEPGWSQARAMSPFFWSTGSARPQAQTRVRAGYADEALYIAYENVEPRMDRVRAIIRRDNAEQILRDDTVEIFLNPVADPKRYYYFVLNTNNARFQKAAPNNGWQDSWEGVTQSGPAGWSAEVRIPFRSLGIAAPLKGGTWKGNFCRRRQQEIAPYHCWSFTFGGVHRIDRFGTLSFIPKPSPSPAPTNPPKP